MSETSKYRHLVAHLCVGNGVDIGSQGDPVVPHAIQVDLPEAEFARYSGGAAPLAPIQWRGDCRKLPFQDNTLDFVFSSHLIEDFDDWEPLLREWARVLKPGGRLIIFAPERSKWHYAVTVLKQPINAAHRREPMLGELTRECARLNLPLSVKQDSLSNLHPNDYNLVFVAEKV